MFEKFKKSAIELISDEIKQKTEEIAESLTDKISDISESVQTKADAISKSAGDIFDSDDNAPIDISVSVEDADQSYSVNLSSASTDAYGQQQVLDEETLTQQENARESFEKLEDRRKSKKGKRIAALATSAAVAIGGFNIASDQLQNAAMVESYDKAVLYIMEEEYDLAVNELDEVTIEDASALASYAYVQSNIDDYVGKPSAMLDAIEEVEAIQNADVKRQKTIAVEDLKLATKIQSDIDSLDLTSVDTISKGDVNEIETHSLKLADRYRKLIVTDKYDLASRVLSNVDEKNAAGQLIADINDLGEVSLDSKDQIADLKAAYNNLSSADKETVLNYSLLASASNIYDKLRKEEDARIAAEKKAEEERIAAEKKAEEERLAAEKKADEERLAAEKEAEEERKAAEAKAEEARLAASASATENEEDMVWVSEHGKKYHSNQYCSNMKNPWQIPRSNVGTREPCKKCRP